MRLRVGSDFLPSILSRTFCPDIIVIFILRKIVSGVEVVNVALTSSQLAKRSLPDLYIFTALTTFQFCFLEVFELRELLTMYHSFVDVFRVGVSPPSNLLCHLIIFNGREIRLFR